MSDNFTSHEREGLHRGKRSEYKKRVHELAMKKLKEPNFRKQDPKERYPKSAFKKRSTGNMG